jgi:hypothetical protein
MHLGSAPASLDGMSQVPAFIRFSAVAAPVLLFVYGVLRLIDGVDGHHGPGFAWNVGHAAFFVAMVLFGFLVLGLRQLVSAGRVRRLANAATVAGIAGVACFLWVILGDLLPDFGDALPVPDPVQLVGPLLFQFGTLALLVVLAAGHSRRLPVWSPVLVFAGFASFAVNLDLIPVGAALVLAGLAPLARHPGGPGTSAGAPAPPAPTGVHDRAS